ncbi:hypothetical protein ACFQ6C_27370 [Streptomyces sp. NPDC056454]|uniref:hypothetical protein n=1 Tax=Streptomyces sp. NPDC056454 TaxID=3345823 RepID=UPI0036B234C1
MPSSPARGWRTSSDTRGGECAGADVQGADTGAECEELNRLLRTLVVTPEGGR